MCIRLAGRWINDVYGRKLSGGKRTREKRLTAYLEKIQEYTLERVKQIIDELIAKRHRQNMTQQEIVNITGIMLSNLARFKIGVRVPTLVVLQKYASALGKRIEIKICDNEGEKEKWDYKAF